MNATLTVSRAMSLFQSNVLWGVLRLILAFSLSACQAPLVSHHVEAHSQDSRVQFIVIHGTEETFTDSLKILTTQNVSSHYLVNRDPAEVWQLVDESARAWHAGQSSWQGHTYLNNASIGIEIVSTSHPGVRYEPYTDAQITAVVALVKDIQKRHHIRADRIVGHGEIQPDHKTDPSALFPWFTLAEAGLIPWPDLNKVREVESRSTDIPDIDWWQSQLSQAGYDCPHTGTWDAHTLKVLQVFRDKYEGQRASLPLSTHTSALLTVITQAHGLNIRRDNQWVEFIPNP
jgi:N-acetylmuramoyl-L-alanine amidase